MTLFLEYIQHHELAQLAAILFVVICVSGLGKLIKQPLLVGYLLAGVMVGPYGLGLVGGSGGEHTFIEFFSHIGIALLLFMVGLGLNLEVIKEHGKTALGIGSVQIFGTALLGFLLSYFLGYGTTVSIYIAIALTFSSTIVIVKLLTDKGDDHTTYGQLAIGLLIVQDIVVMVALMTISIMGEGSSVGTMALGGCLLILGTILFSKFVLPRLLTWLARTQEFLLLIGIGFCLILGALFEFVGFSFEIGSLLAGMAFAASPFRLEIGNKLKYLRDFFLVLFFINIGMKLSFTGLGSHLYLLFGALLLVVVGKPLLVYATTLYFQYTQKTSFKTSTSIAQISEFSFLLVGIGLSQGHLTDGTLLSVVLIVGLVSILLSSYFTTYNNQLYTYREKLFPKKNISIQEEIIHTLDQIDIILFGYGRMGSKIGNIFDRDGVNYAVVDHDPALVSIFAKKNVPYVYADATNTEAWRSFFGPGLKMIISSMKDFEDDMLVIKEAKEQNESLIVIVVATKIQESVDLYEQGADYVIFPDYISAHHTTMMIDEIGFDIEKFIEKRVEHLSEIN